MCWIKNIPCQVPQDPPRHGYGYIIKRLPGMRNLICTVPNSIHICLKRSGTSNTSGQGAFTFFHESDREKAQKLAESYRKIGIKIKVLSREEVLEKEPYMNPEVAGATYSSIDGNVNPFRLIDMYMRAPKRNGVRYSAYNKVTEIKKHNGKYLVVSDKGAFECKNLILAGEPGREKSEKCLELRFPLIN